MKSSELETAIETREALKRVLTFLRGMQDWQGSIGLSFGSYRCELEGPECRIKLLVLLQGWRDELRKSLEALGVEEEDA